MLRRLTEREENVHTAPPKVNVVAIKRRMAGEVADKKTGKKYEVIDWRCRPPLKPYQGLYTLRIKTITERANTVAKQRRRNLRRNANRWPG